MKNLTFTTIAALSLSANAALAATVTIDFDGIANGFYGPSDGTQGFQATGIGGLNFSTPILVNTANAGAGPGQTGKVGQQATPPFGGDPKGGTFGGTFDGFTVSALSILVGDSGGDMDTFQLVGYDTAGSILADSGSITSQAATTVDISFAGIASFDLFISDQPDNGGSSFFDNITFDTEEIAAVPLPAGGLLLLSGLGGVAAFKRRKKRAA